jgi:hypothetical protein
LLKYLLSILFLSFFYWNLYSQEVTKLTRPCKSNIIFENEFYIGKIIKNYPVFPETDLTFFDGFEISKQTTGNKAWHKEYGYPRVGVSFIYGELGNKNVLGENFSIAPDISFISKNSSKWHSETKIGIGLSYFNRKYNRISNPGNLIIGSSVTNITYLSFGVLYNVSENFSIKAGASAFHFSDGHYQLPNIGLNILLFNIGIKYYPFPKSEIKNNNPTPVYEHKLRINLQAGSGLHEFGFATKPIGGPKYPVYLATIYLSEQYSIKGIIQSGLFINYYTGFHDYIINQELFDSKNPQLKSFVLGLFIGHEYIFGRIGAVAQSSFNFYSPFLKKYYRSINDYDFNTKMKIYNSNKIGFKYYILRPVNNANKYLYLGIFIKANSGQADVVEYSVGFTF